MDSGLPFHRRQTLHMSPTTHTSQVPGPGATLTPPPPKAETAVALEIPGDPEPATVSSIILAAHRLHENMRILVEGARDASKIRDLIASGLDMVCVCVCVHMRAIIANDINREVSNWLFCGILKCMCMYVALKKKPGLRRVSPPPPNVPRRGLAPQTLRGHVDSPVGPHH